MMRYQPEWIIEPYLTMFPDYEFIDSLRLELPRPPSSNKAFRPLTQSEQLRAKLNGKKLFGLRKTEDYRNWNRLSAIHLRNSSKFEACEDFSEKMNECTRYAIAHGVWRIREICDITNYTKCMHDWLVRHKIIADDSLVDQAVQYAIEPNNHFCYVDIYAFNPRSSKFGLRGNIPL